MGNTIFRGLFGKKEARILIMGLNGVGKNTCLNRLKLGEVVTTNPTIRFNAETVTTWNMSNTAWDLGGRVKIRPLYRHSFDDYRITQGLVYVLDSNDSRRLALALAELQRCVLNKDETLQIPLLILANKQDLPGALSPEQIMSKLKALNDHQLSERTWAVYGVSAVDTHMNGLTEAFEWLANSILNKETQNVAENWIQAWYPASKENNKNQEEEKLAVEKKSFFSSWVESLKKIIM